jgi:hypothetical protein
MDVSFGLSFYDLELIHLRVLGTPSVPQEPKRKRKRGKNWQKP